MRTNDNTQYNVEDAFDCRYLNVFKLYTVRQCEIAIAEIKYQADNIERDLRDRADDEGWNIGGARVALADYQHKARMVVLRREEIAEDKEAKKNWIANHSAAFFKCAREALNPDVFARIQAKVDLQLPPKLDDADSGREHAKKGGGK